MTERGPRTHTPGVWLTVCAAVTAVWHMRGGGAWQGAGRTCGTHHHDGQLSGVEGLGRHATGPDATSIRQTLSSGGFASGPRVHGPSTCPRGLGQWSGLLGVASRDWGALYWGLHGRPRIIPGLYDLTRIGSLGTGYYAQVRSTCRLADGTRVRPARLILFLPPRMG